MDKKIHVISWDAASKKLPVDNPNEEFCNLVTSICAQLKTDKKDYVYHMQLEFGDKLIDKGKRFKYEGDEEIPAAFKIDKNDYNKTISDFTNDLSYSSDPLGMVVKNHIEVFSENTSKNKNIKHNYTVPLNVIREGGLFGVFGVLDYLACPQEVIELSSDWYVIAGNACFEILFPFSKSSYYSNIENDKIGKIKGPSKLSQNKIELVKSYLYDEKQNDSEKWTADIIYFPLHFVAAFDDKLKKLLFDQGWQQSYSLRNSQFENKLVADTITSIAESYIFKHNDIFLNFLLRYLYIASKGQQYVLKPIQDPKHVLSIFLSLMKKDDKIAAYLKKPTHFEFILLHYDQLKENEFGVISIDSIPILLNYELKTPGKLKEEIEKIKTKLQEKKIPIPEISFTSNTGVEKATNSNTKVRTQEKENLKTKLSALLKIEEKHINLTEDKLSHLIILNR